MVSYADLPDKVSGFAETIEGQAYIVLNRAKSRTDLEYTLPHELGHHVLQAPVKGTEELAAHLFAVAWITWPGNARRDEVLQKNAEASATLLTCLAGTLVFAFVALMVYFNSKFAPTHPTLPQAK